MATTMTTTPTPCRHIITTTNQTKKVIGMFFYTMFILLMIFLGAIDNVNDGMAPFPLPPHHINATHPCLLSPLPPHQCIRHHHHYHPTLTCQCNFTPIQPTSATTFFLNHNTHHHHQQVLMTRWWVYLVSPPPRSPLPSPSTMTLTMATNKSRRLVGVFSGLSTIYSTHHRHR